MDYKVNKVNKRKMTSQKYLTYVTALVCLISSANLNAAGNQAIYCDKDQSAFPQYIYSIDSPVKNGTIQSSRNYPKSYENNVNCIVYLIGAENERVKVNFVQDFDVKAVPPRCLHDYVDIYILFKDTDESLLNSALQGRFCGKDTDNLPNLIISMYQIFVVGFYTDASDGAKGFKLQYEFIKDDRYRIGTPASNDVCGITVHNQTTGTLLSPTYPGIYPDDIFCYYNLYGKKGQRIRINFHDIDIYAGGEHCPFDFIKLYDGSMNSDPVIATICGDHKEMILYSTMENLTIEFSTKSGRRMPPSPDEENPKMRGFNASFEISSKFINSDYMKEGEHILGTECDRVIHSGGETSGYIQSPNYPNPYPANAVCEYFIDGLIDRQNLEKVELTIETLDIGQNKTKSGSCEYGALLAYLGGQTILDDVPPPRNYCGIYGFGDIVPIATTNPRLKLVFNSTPSVLLPPPRPVSDHQTINPGNHTGFRAKYKFVTDYAIPGTTASANSTCRFIYRSEGGLYGTFNSPRHPSNYPDNAFCVYDFFGNTDEKIRITFENFHVENGTGNNCTKDHVTAYKIVYAKLSSEVQVGQYCGWRLPGPIDEDTNVLKIILKSDSNGVRQGFRAKYEFVKKPLPEKKCVYNITNEVGGKIESPNYHHKYSTNISCEWTITARLNHQIMLVFDVFNLEGNPLEKMGCGNAVLKIYTSSNSGTPAHEFCGENSTLPSKVIISNLNYMRIKFISSSKATGERGFRLPWTEIYPRSAHRGDCKKGFLCKVSRHCISSSLRCNKMNNCGLNDTSDETTDCGAAYREHGALNIILGIVLSLIALIIIIVCIIHRRRTTSKQEKKEIEVRFMTRSDSALLYDPASTAYNKMKGAEDNESGGIVNGGQGSLLRMKTEKVSII